MGKNLSKKIVTMILLLLFVGLFINVAIVPIKSTIAEEIAKPNVADLRSSSRMRASSALLSSKVENSDAVVADEQSLNTLGNDNIKNFVNAGKDIYVPDKSSNKNVIASHAIIKNNEVAYEPLIALGVNGEDIAKEEIDYVDYATNKTAENKQGLSSQYTPDHCFGSMTADLIANKKQLVATAFLTVTTNWKETILPGAGYYYQCGFVVDSQIVPKPYKNWIWYDMRVYSYDIEVMYLHFQDDGFNKLIDTNDGQEPTITNSSSFSKDTGISVAAKADANGNSVQVGVDRNYSFVSSSSVSYEKGSHHVVQFGETIDTTNEGSRPVTHIKDYRMIPNAALDSNGAVANETNIPKNKTYGMKIANAFEFYTNSYYQTRMFFVMKNIRVKGVGSTPDYGCDSTSEGLAIFNSCDYPDISRSFTMSVPQEGANELNDNISNPIYMSTFNRQGNVYEFDEVFGIAGL